jgi:lipid-binding SYLF domain-containing protein
MHLIQRKNRLMAFVLAAWIIGAMAAAAAPCFAEPPDKQTKLVDEAVAALNNFLADPEMTWFQNNVQYAKGVLIIPELIKAGFVFGTSGGRGVLSVRDPETGEWSQPAFYMIGSVSLGFQIGAKASEVMMMIMSPKGLTPLYGSSFKLGGEASVAAGPVGAGAEGATAMNLSADYLSFARSKGAFVGLSLGGAYVYADGEWNAQYYGKLVEPEDILTRRQVTNPHSSELIRILDKATKQ